EHRARRGRGDAAVPSRGGGGGRDRRPGPRVGPACGGLRRRPPGGLTDGRGARRLLPPAARELQEARGDPLRRRAAEEPDGQDPPARPARAARRRVSSGHGPSRARRPPSRHPRPASGPAVELAVRDGVAWLTLARPASTTAALALPELGERRFPGGGVTQRLPRLIGTARAMELVLLGTRLPAVTAAAWGLVSAAVAPTRLASTVEETAHALAQKGPLALRLGKEAVVRALDLPLADGIRLEHDLYVLLQTT